jgi:hypothetical protein
VAIRTRVGRQSIHGCCSRGTLGCHAFTQKIGITLAGLGKFDDSFGELIAPALPGAFSPGANFVVIDR